MHTKFISLVLIIYFLFPCQVIADPCKCTGGSTPTCGSNERFVCAGGYPLCLDRKNDARTPTCFNTSSTSGSNSTGGMADGCCRNCPNNSKPTCPERYSYWCVNGTPQCCRSLTYGGLDCVARPSCFLQPPAQQPLILCNDLTRYCPNGSNISCPAGTQFKCLNGQPDCCDGDRCTDELDPLCFYTKQCGNNFTGCCMLCPDSSIPACPSGTTYWCSNGRPDCCTDQGGQIVCTPEEDPVCFVEDRKKCQSLTASDPCCMLCQDGSSPVCPAGKSHWCEKGTLKCCNNTGTECELPASCSGTYRCPNNPLPETGCCKVCPNLFDRPSCPSGLEYWCKNGIQGCCKQVSGRIFCSPVHSPKCSSPATRQCSN